MIQAWKLLPLEAFNITGSFTTLPFCEMASNSDIIYDELQDQCVVTDLGHTFHTFQIFPGRPGW